MTCSAGGQSCHATYSRTIFSLGGHRECRSYVSWYFVRVPSANFGDTMTIHFPFMGHWANTAQTDHVTLRPRPRPVADACRRPPSVHQV